jgi:hypothetical protein
MRPCLPGSGGEYPNDEIIRESRSFATLDGYHRHVVSGHFIAQVNAPLPYMLAEDILRWHTEERR